MTDPALVERALAKAESTHQFTDDEIAALKEMANAWRGLEAFGRVANVLRKVLAYVGWLIAVYVGVKYVIVEWIKGLPK